MLGEWKTPSSTSELSVFHLSLQTHPPPLLSYDSQVGSASGETPTGRDQRASVLSALPLQGSHGLAASLHQRHLQEAPSTCYSLLFWHQFPLLPFQSQRK